MHWGEVSQTLAQESFVQTITVKHLVSFAKGFLKCIFDYLLFNVKTCSMCAKLSFYVRPMFKQDRIVFIVDILLLSEIIQYVEGCGTSCYLGNTNLVQNFISTIVCEKRCLLCVFSECNAEQK